MKCKSAGHHVSEIGITDNIISGRGGLLFILRYLEKCKIFNLLSSTIGIIGNGKSKPVGFMLRQIIAKMIDGSSPSIVEYDRLKQDAGYASVLELSQEDMVSSHMVKRFFAKFRGMKHRIYRKVLHKLFIWRLWIEQPSLIVLDLDTMLMDNDDAKKREGVDVGYEKKLCFQPIQTTWNGVVVDALFRRGSAHSNHGDDVKHIIRGVVNLIRSEYSQNVPIIVTMDSGFLDQDNFGYFEEELKIGYVCYGKLYDSVKDDVKKIDSGRFKVYDNGKKKRLWEYCEFESKLKSWEKPRRTIFTRPLEKKGQLLLEFARPESVIYTNIGMDEKMTKQLIDTGNKSFLGADKIVQLAHSRGTSELTNRSLKDFMTREQLPFKRFGMNGAYYYVLLIAHFLVECYKRDVTHDVLPVSSYATAFRRKLIDFAAKMVKSGSKIKIKVTRAIWDNNKISQLWHRCNDPIPIHL